jgi:hypothetical protein
MGDILTTYRVEQEDKRDLIRTIAVLLEALGGEFVITRDKIENMMLENGEIRIHRSTETNAVRLKYNKHGIGNTE